MKNFKATRKLYSPSRRKPPNIFIANYLFDTLNANLSGEDDEINPELEYLKIIREIRDNDK